MKINTSLLALSLLASASGFAAETYQVTTSVYTNGELVASPVVLVEADKATSMTIGENFSYNLTVKPNQDETADIITALTLENDTLTPSFTVAYGKEASIEIGTQKLTILVSRVDNQ
ncbi:hypothetical protein [Pseudoalteromonas sp. T1lg76]|uniref:hypothetical protein n=1 Tax=Pseudoalteromonas sp. T1lg76 TaxID=2077103 RepID=UPI000CF620B2|nr:hypothetical protein [Pseudoalteromonas sp. T1lg76]